MNHPKIYRGESSSVCRAEVQQALGAWHSAAARLEQAQGDLTRCVGEMIDELDSRNRHTTEQDTLDALRQLATGLANDVCRHHQSVAGHARLLRDRLADDPAGLELVQQIEANCAALVDSASDLSRLASDREPQCQSLAVRELVEDVCAILTPQLEAQGIDAVIDVPRSLQVSADRPMLRAAILNLALNAVDAMPRGGRLVVTGFVGRWGWEIEVADSGPGLSDAVRSRIFQPFFTTKHGGRGLGLTIVHRIAEAHGGEVIATNCPEGGAAFTLRLPRRAAAAA